MHSRAVRLSHDARRAGRVDRVERRDVADVLPVRELARVKLDEPRAKGTTREALARLVSSLKKKS